MKIIKLSPQQEAVIDWVRNGEGSLNVKSYAGTGKTFQLMAVAKIIKGQAFMGAFSRSIADEFVAKLAEQQSWNVKGGTVHQGGMGTWLRSNPDARVQQHKVRMITKSMWTDRKLVDAVVECVEFMKQACLGVGDAALTVEAVQDIVDYYDLQDAVPGKVSVEKYIECCLIVYRKSLEACAESIDFSDMLLAPLYYEAPFRKYDWVLVDELQDTSLARRLILLSMMKPGTRVIGAGDPHQSIFQFSGASADSMTLFKDALGAGELPLSVTYRCPKAVVAMAQRWVPDYTAHESAPEGVVGEIEAGDFWREKFTPEDVILCRNTRPLVGVAGRLREKGVACVVEGMNGKGLVSLALKWGEGVKIQEYLTKLDVYQLAEVEKWEARGNEQKADSVRDRCGTLRDAAGKLKGAATSGDLAGRLEFLLGLGKVSLNNILHLCTVHRFKGREANRVFLLGRNRYMPSPWAHKDWEIQSENNVQYVAETRAREEFVDVVVPPKVKGESGEWWEA